MTREEYLPHGYAEFLRHQLDQYRAKSFMLLVRYPDNFQHLGNMSRADLLTTVFEILLYDAIQAANIADYRIHPKALASMEERFQSVMMEFSKYCMQVLSIPEALQKK